METLENLARIYNDTLWINVFLAPFLLCLVLYVVYRKREEFSHDAVRNTAATIIVGGLNFAVALIFFNEFDAGAQAVYDALHIPHLPREIWDSVPFWLVCVLGIIAKDLVDYWNHRLMHTEWGWPTHAAHHSDTYVNAFTTYRVHILEALLMSLSYIVLLTWLQMPAAIPVVVMLSSLHNMYVHMDLPYHHGPLRYVLASPAFHRWHHADAPEAYGKNLANVMPLWDRLFGTYYDAGRCQEPMGALATGVEDKNPLAIFFYPFFEWARLIRKATAAHPAPSEPDRTLPDTNRATT